MLPIVLAVLLSLFRLELDDGVGMNGIILLASLARGIV